MFGRLDTVELDGPAPEGGTRSQLDRTPNEFRLRQRNADSCVLAGSCCAPDIDADFAFL